MKSKTAPQTAHDTLGVSKGPPSSSSNIFGAPVATGLPVKRDLNLDELVQTNTKPNSENYTKEIRVDQLGVS